MEILTIVLIVIAGLVLYGIITIFTRHDSIQLRQVMTLQQHMKHNGYCTAHMAMTRLYHSHDKGGEFVPLSVIHAIRCQDCKNPAFVSSQYLSATEADLDLLVEKGILSKRTEENNLSRQVWYKFVYAPQIRLVA